MDQATYLPVTETALRNALFIPSNVSFGRFRPLAELYREIKQDASHWQHTLYPELFHQGLVMANYSLVNDELITTLKQTITQMSEATTLAQAQDHKQRVAELLNILADLSLSLQNASRSASDKVIDYSADMQANSAQLRAQRDHFQTQNFTINGRPIRPIGVIVIGENTVEFACFDNDTPGYTPIGGDFSFGNSSGGILIGPSPDPNLAILSSYHCAITSVQTLLDEITPLQSSLGELKLAWQITQSSIAQAQMGVAQTQQNLDAFAGLADVLNILVDTFATQWQQTADQAQKISQNAPDSQSVNLLLSFVFLPRVTPAAFLGNSSR